MIIPLACRPGPASATGTESQCPSSVAWDEPEHTASNSDSQALCRPGPVPARAQACRQPSLLRPALSPAAVSPPSEYGPAGANPELVLSARNAEGGLELVLLADTELRVSALEVQHREEAGAPGLVDELLNVGQGLHGALRDGVEAAVVLAESPRAIRLGREDD
jgi:hypothetical protein